MAAGTGVRSCSGALYELLAVARCISVRSAARMTDRTSPELRAEAQAFLDQLKTDAFEKYE
jgi:hypothetical protein